MGKSSAGAVLVGVFSLFIALLLAEGLLRIYGFTPWHYTDQFPNEPVMHQPHPVLGWQSKQGHYVTPPYSPNGKLIHTTFLDHGKRRSSNRPTQDAQAELIVVGGSFTQGWAVNDEETYAWKLQQAFPATSVLNYGTGGYGSYQSLLVLERELPRAKAPKLVLYGFMPHHEARNVAAEWWMRTLATYSRRYSASTPFATIGPNNVLKRHPPAHYIALPFREWSALTTLLGQAYMQYSARDRLSQKEVVTGNILLQMKKVSTQYGANFAVVILTINENNKNRFKAYLSNNDIDVLDCSHRLTPELIVRGEGHPNGRLHSLWAQCIQDNLGGMSVW